MMEVQEDIGRRQGVIQIQERVREEIFPAQGEKVPSDAKKFLVRLKKIRKSVDDLEVAAQDDCVKSSLDVKHWSQLQLGLMLFDPWIREAERQKQAGLPTPATLVEACGVLGSSKVLYVH